MTLSRKNPLRTTTPIAPVSQKRLAKLAAAGVSFLSSTFALRPTSRPAKRPASTGFDRATTDAVLQRDDHSCVRCGGALHGERGRDWSIQHRRARGSGGSRRPDTNAPQNGIAVCGSATSVGGCHEHIESEREDARAHGWAIRQSEDPLLVPVDHALHGHVWLTADGGWSHARPKGAS